MVGLDEDWMNKKGDHDSSGRRVGLVMLPYKRQTDYLLYLS